MNSLIASSTRLLMGATGLIDRYSWLIVVAGALTMTSSANAQFSTVVNVPPELAPEVIDSDTQLNLFDGGTVGDYDFFGLSDGTSTNVEVNIVGGSTGFNVQAYGSTVNISGGAVGDFFYSEAAKVNLSGGTVGHGFGAFEGSSFHVSGGEFRLDNAPINITPGNSVPLNVPTFSVLSGTLADGSPFSFCSLHEDYIADGTLTLDSVALPPVGPSLITASTDPVPTGIRQGQTLVVDAGAAVPNNFTAGWGSKVSVEGGTIGSIFDAIGATVDIPGGSVGDRFIADTGTTVNLTGGSIGYGFSVNPGAVVNIVNGSVGDACLAFGSTVNILGGFVGSDLVAAAGSEINILGGAVFLNFRAQHDSTVNISGGWVAPGFHADGESKVNLFGTEFFLDGAPIEGLTFGQPLVWSGRSGTLSGLHPDGLPFEFPLASVFANSAQLTLTLVPEPSTALLAVIALAGLAAYQGRMAGRRFGGRDCRV